jgi:glyoxylase-like metal-dependent hydrolase (beta-lactamase superfamily II)
MTLAVSAAEWYETIRFADGVTLIHEPWIKPFFRCNMWHVRGRDRDLLFDSGLGHFSLKSHVRLVAERDLVCVASHTHFDHIGCHHEFPGCCVHRAEADILADPRNDRTYADKYATDDMFIQPPEGWDQSRYAVLPAKAGRILEHGDVIDLGDRVFKVIHTPGHSPGGIGLFERRTGTLLSGDVIYDGPLIDGQSEVEVADYISTMQMLAKLPATTIHGGHYPSFGPVRFRQIIDEYLDGKRKAGCHLATQQP